MIDWSKAAELREEIGEEDFAEVVEVFLEEVDEAIQALREGVGDDMLEASLHFLKGSALNLGFDAFSKLCADGENAAAAGNFAEIDTAKLVEIYDLSKTMFLSELEARLAA